MPQKHSGPYNLYGKSLVAEILNTSIDNIALNIASIESTCDTGNHCKITLKNQIN